MGPLWFECTRNKNPEVKAEWVIVATVGDREVPHVAHTMLATDYPIGTQVQVEIHTIVKVLKAEEVK